MQIARGVIAGILLFSGFLVGGCVLVEYYAPGVLIVPLLPFLVGGMIGSLIIGIFTE